MNIIETNLKWNGSLAYNNKPRFIILHHAEASSCSIEDIHQWHLQNGWVGCGYQFLVRKDGLVYRGRPENAQGAHCPNYNATSIGICAEGEYMNETMPEVQKRAVIELGRYLRDKYSIKTVYGHGEVYSTNCPGNNYPLSEIKSYILNDEPLPGTEETPKIKLTELIVTAQVPAILDTSSVVKCFKKGDNITAIGAITTDNIDYWIVDIYGQKAYVPMGNTEVK